MEEGSTMVAYYSLGKDKKLNEIVIAGSHDAGITGGRMWTQTQSLDIYGQAKAGVRVFDIRIAAGGRWVHRAGAELKTFHGPQVTRGAKDVKVKGLTMVARYTGGEAEGPDVRLLG